MLPQLNLPSTIPAVPSGGVTMTTPNKYRYYMNVCTVRVLSFHE